ncbi:enoyl-[acyl-carrier-protein] reductase [NADH], chloroplastic-like protein, partial [Tanacetum coccineum]
FVTELLEWQLLLPICTLLYQDPLPFLPVKFQNRALQFSVVILKGRHVRSLEAHVTSLQLRHYRKLSNHSPLRFGKVITKAMSEFRERRASLLYSDDNGIWLSIAKSLAAAGAEILVGTWVPALNIFETSLRRGKFDESRVLPDGSLMEITKVYPLDAVYDTPEDVPEDVKSNKRYAGSSKWTVKEVAESVKEDFGSIDILVHSLANGPEMWENRKVESMLVGNGVKVGNFLYGGALICLTYIASERIIPG